MVVKVSKPEINVREKISELDKPSGLAGQAILAAETPQEQFNLIGAGRRNLLHNSQFMISQRGDYMTNPLSIAGGTPTFTADRWFTYANGGILHFLFDKIINNQIFFLFKLSIIQTCLFKIILEKQ